MNTDPFNNPDLNQFLIRNRRIHNYLKINLVVNRGRCVSFSDEECWDLGNRDQSEVIFIFMTLIKQKYANRTNTDFSRPRR